MLKQFAIAIAFGALLVSFAVAEHHEISHTSNEATQLPSVQLDERQIIKVRDLQALKTELKKHRLEGVTLEQRKLTEAKQASALKRFVAESCANSDVLYIDGFKCAGHLSGDGMAGAIILRVRDQLKIAEETGQLVQRHAMEAGALLRRTRRLRLAAEQNSEVLPDVEQELLAWENELRKSCCRN